MKSRLSESRARISGRSAARVPDAVRCVRLQALALDAAGGTARRAPNRTVDERILREQRVGCCPRFQSAPVPAPD